MANILLGVTGSVAAIRTPKLYQMLKEVGHTVKVVATQASLYFFDPFELDAIDGQRNKDVLILDEDEWPGREQGQRYQRNDDVVHIELRRWADLYLIAPLDANTLAKLANGLSDNCLTCVWRAWEPSRPVVLAPAMNTLMWQHPLTLQHLRSLASMCSLNELPSGLSLETIVEWINANCSKLRVVPPQSKQLACGDVGIGAMAELSVIMQTMNQIAPGN